MNKAKNMTLKWDEKLECGVGTIDEQHKILFDLAKDLNSAVINGATNQVIEVLFNVITNYAYTHFETEEKLLKNDKVHLDHCVQHYKLLKKWHEYMVDFHNNRHGSVDPGSFLELWLTDHIREEDLPGFERQLKHLKIEDEDDFLDESEIVLDEESKRKYERIRYDMVLDTEINAQYFNATSTKHGIAKVIDLSGGGLKLYSERPFNVDDLLVINCKVGKTFSMNEKVFVKNIDEHLYGVEFVAPAAETVRFLTELKGAIGNYY